MKGGIYPTRYGWQVRFGKITKRFKDYGLAERFLTGLRFKSDEGTFDIRDYRMDNPLGFENMVEKFLESKRLLKGVNKYEQRLRFGTTRFGNRNIKTIGFYDIEGLIIRLQEDGKSSKYVKDIRDTIKMFYRWCLDCGEIKYEQMPKFPTVKWSSPYRKVVNKEIQDKIVSEVHRLTWHFNPRIYIGINFLRTYINIRPGELIKIKEKDIDLANARILIEGKNEKTGKEKYIYLLADDVSLLESFGTSFGNLHFFRHLESRGGNPPNSRFGKTYLYRWWKTACGNLGSSGVDLYGGTRHSSAIDLRKRHSPEAIKRATGHTSKAFDRYLEITGDELRLLYADTRGEVLEIKNEKRNKV